MFLQLSLFCLLAIVAADPVPAVGDKEQLPSEGQYGQGGHDVKIQDAPHQVSLHALGKNYCGGSIISPTWLVTAAKCIHSPTNVMTVRSGSTKQSSGGKIHTIKQAIQHPNYTINQHAVPINDVAVVQVNPPFELHEIPKAIALSKDKVPSGANATITGWGSTSENGTQWDTLQRLYLPIVSRESCDAAYQEIVKLPEAKICSLASEGGTSVCNGDEGSPLTINNKLAGIVSWHYGCGQKGYPDVHTEVFPFRDWIITTTGITE